MLVFPWSLESYVIKKGKIHHRKIYNHMKEQLGKNWYKKRLLRLHTSDDYPEVTNDEISDENIKCEECTR